MSRWQSADVLFNVEFEPTIDLHEDRPARKLPYADWHQSAACVNRPPEEFFGATDTTMRPALTMSDVKRAKAVCASCPVFTTCLTSALGLSGPREEFGIWAGTTGRTRRRIWELEAAGEVTLVQVVRDIVKGDGRQYERKVALTPVAIPVAIRRQAS